MNEAQYALAGVAVGSLVPVVVTLWSAGREDRRVAEDRQESRDALLFDHRREAYAGYIRVARGLLDALWQYHEGVYGERPPPDFDFADSLVEAQAPVQLYGSAEALERARAVLTAIYAYESDKTKYEEVEAEISSFAGQARLDLGVPAPARRAGA